MSQRDVIYEFSIFKEGLNKKISLYHGLYHIKKRELINTFSTLNGRTFKEHIDDLDKLTPKINKNELEYMWQEAEDLYTIIGRIPFCTELKPRILLLYQRIRSLKNVVEETEKFKDMYYDIMDDFLRDMVDYHFNNLTYDNLMEIERINYLKCLFTEFESYIFNSFKHIMMKYPEVLKKKSILLDDLEILKDLNKELILEIIAEKTLHDLLYKDFKEILNFADKPLGLKVKITNQIISRFNAYKQIRNLYTHGDGEVNMLYIKKVKKYKLRDNIFNPKALSIGMRINITIEMIKEIEKLIMIISTELDKVLIKSCPELISDNKISFY